MAKTYNKAAKFALLTNTYNEWRGDTGWLGGWYCLPANVMHYAEVEVETDEMEFWFHDRV